MSKDTQQKWVGEKIIEFSNYVDMNWQRMDGGDLVDVDHIKWLRTTLTSFKEKVEEERDTLWRQTMWTQIGLDDQERIIVAFRRATKNPLPREKKNE